MDFLYILIIIFAVAAILTVLTAFICYRRVFYSKPRRPLGEDEYDIPSGEKYDAYRPQLLAWAKNKRSLPCLELTVTSFDGLTLRGKYYEYEKNAPVEILFHGYKGNAERDLSGAIERCFSVGRSAILVDQRAAGASEGHIISFGINECKDCLRWVDKVIEVFGEDVEIVLGGVSMGAATVTMASAENLPENVKYVVSDCPYNCPEDIIKKSIKEMKLPPMLLYPMVKLGARLFGHFSLSENFPLRAVRESRLPIIFFHGTDDDFVPLQMSEALFAECRSPKKLVLIDGAAHGLAYPADKDGYVAAIKDFEKQISVFRARSPKQ